MNKSIVNLLLIITILYSCNKPCNEPDYQFSVTYHFFPEKQRYQIGDTIWLECIFSKNLFDNGTQSNVYFSDVKSLASNLFVSNIDSFSNGNRGAVNYFEYLKISGKILTISDIDPKGTKHLFWDESDSAFLLKAGIITREKGRFLLTIPNAPNVSRSSHRKCGLGNFYFLNDNGDQHLDLFEDKWGALSNYDRLSSYAFIVE